MYKGTPTKIRRPLSSEYGRILLTYSSVERVNGKDVPVIDVWSDEFGPMSSEKIKSLSNEERERFFSSITLGKDTVILSNGDVFYPKDFEDETLRGKPIRGFYNEDGTFNVDQKDGTDTLQDEYLSNMEYVEKAYNVRPSTIPQFASKGGVSYVFLPFAEKVSDSNGNMWEVSTPTKYISINLSKDGEILDPSAIELEVFERTYQVLQEELKEKGLTA